MIFLKTQHEDVFDIAILRTEDLEHLKAGEPLQSPNKELLILWTPDVDWLLAEMVSRQLNTVAQVVQVVEESTKRPEKASTVVKKRGQFTIGTEDEE